MDYKSYGDYKVYINGTVWSNKTSKFLKQCLNHLYINVKLTINGKRLNVSVHRLMGVLFLPNIKNLPEIDHKDRNKLNNSLFNLKWSSKSDNRHNKGISINNTSGYKGVGYNKTRKIWVARMEINGKKYEKSSKTKEKAILYRLEFEAEYEISLIRNTNITSIIARV